MLQGSLCIFMVSKSGVLCVLTTLKVHWSAKKVMRMVQRCSQIVRIGGARFYFQVTAPKWCTTLHNRYIVTVVKLWPFVIDKVWSLNLEHCWVIAEFHRAKDQVASGGPKMIALRVEKRIQSWHKHAGTLRTHSCSGQGAKQQRDKRDELEQTFQALKLDSIRFSLSCAFI